MKLCTRSLLETPRYSIYIYFLSIRTKINKTISGGAKVMVTAESDHEPMIKRRRSNTPVNAISYSTYQPFSRVQKKSSSPKLLHTSKTVHANQKELLTTSAENFSSLGVDSWLVRSLEAMAVTQPTKIQSMCIPQILRGKDCIGGSRTGSGKTIAFTVPILQQWARDPFGTFALVLTPTRYFQCVTQLRWTC